MKNYEEMARSVIDRRDAYVKQKKAQRKRWAATLSCFCVCALLGVGVWQGSLHLGKNTVEGQNGSLSAPEDIQPTTPVAPENKHETAPGEYGFGWDWQSEPSIYGNVGGTPLAPQKTLLTQTELYSAMGSYLPDTAPEGFLFEEAYRDQYGYYVRWSRGLEDFELSLRTVQTGDYERLTRVEDTVNYDLSLYPIPRAESVPEALREIVNDPVFRAEELTQSAVLARAYTVSDSGDSQGYRMHFSVLYGETLVTVTSKGVDPQWLYEKLSAMGA